MWGTGQGPKATADPSPLKRFVMTDKSCGRGRPRLLSRAVASKGSFDCGRDFARPSLRMTRENQGQQQGLRCAEHDPRWNPTSAKRGQMWGTGRKGTPTTSRISAGKRRQRQKNERNRSAEGAGLGAGPLVCANSRMALPVGLQVTDRPVARGGGLQERRIQPRGS